MQGAGLQERVTPPCVRCRLIAATEECVGIEWRVFGLLLGDGREIHGSARKGYGDGPVTRLRVYRHGPRSEKDQERDHSHNRNQEGERERDSF